MGEDFLRNKNECFVRRRDAHFERMVEPDLFSKACADQQVEVVGQLPPGSKVEAGDEVWAPAAQPSSLVRFFRGDEEAVVGGAAAAAHVKAASGGGAVVAKVTEVVDGLAVLCVVPLEGSESS